MQIDLIKISQLKELIKPTMMKLTQDYVCELNKELTILIDKSIDRAKQDHRRKLLRRDV